MIVAYLGLGANLGDPRSNLARAIEALDAEQHTRVLTRARIYRTKPLGPAGQPDYFNTAVKIETSLGELELLAFVKRIEVQLGRVPSERWGPRMIDLDLLLYGDRTFSHPSLSIPHRELSKRRFVLAPMLEIAAEVLVPDTGHSIRALHDALDDDPGGVHLDA
jgi:2-amino-4-hydroxy-6-hydroxymethyldihydropteridine diphosphokinase